MSVFSVESNSWFDYVLDWERVMEDNPDYPIHVMFFEDMKEVHVSSLSIVKPVLSGPSQID